MSQAFMDKVEVTGGANVLKAFKAFSSELQKDLVETIADRQLGEIARAMRAEVLSLRTKTDETYTRKGTGRRWPYLRRGVEMSPGTARNKVGSAIAVIPLGSKQRRLFVGKRIGVTGRSGAFYGRLIEKGFMLRRSGGWVKSDREIPGKWPLYRLFKRLKPGVEAEVVREFSEFISDWKGSSKVSKQTNSKDLS